jgi:hypothetical protein
VANPAWHSLCGLSHMPSAQKYPTARGQPPSAEQSLDDELEQQQIVDLPAREALSIVDPGVFGVGIPPPLGRTADQPPTEPDAASSAPPEA